MLHISVEFENLSFKIFEYSETISALKPINEICSESRFGANPKVGVATDGAAHGLIADPPVGRPPASMSVAKAVAKRVEAGKTLDLGVWTPALDESLREMFDSTAIFPMGAVDKTVVEYDGEKRPTDDHSRTGLNAATSIAREGEQGPTSGGVPVGIIKS